MISARHLFATLLFCGLFANSSISQTRPSKSVEWPTVTPVTSSEVSIAGGRFQSKAGGFEIKIPDMAFQTLDFGSEKARAKGIDVGKQYIWRFETTLYTIMYSPPLDPDGNPLPQVLEDLVNGSRKGALRENAKLISEKPFMSGNFRGTELRYVSAEGVNYINRLFLVGDIGYQVVGGYINGKEKDVLDVLNSFKLIDSTK